MAGDRRTAVQEPRLHQALMAEREEWSITEVETTVRRDKRLRV